MLNIKERYRYFCRWQQATPHFVNRHEGIAQHCHNCGTEFADNFCPRCGQRAEVGRVDWNSIKENIALLWGMDSRSLLYTLFQLLTRPGYLIRDYISGRRLVSFPPVKMLVIISLLAFLFESVFHVENKILTMNFKIPELDNIVKWFNENKSWGTLFYQLFFIVPTWIIFRFAPRYPRHTLPEGFFLQVFLSSLSLFLSFLDYIDENVENVIASFYLVITYHQLFGYKWWGTLWRCAATVLVSLLLLISIIAVGIIIFEYDFATLDILASLAFFSADLVIIAIILSISYFISRRTDRKMQEKNPEYQ